MNIDNSIKKLDELQGDHPHSCCPAYSEMRQILLAGKEPLQNTKEVQISALVNHIEALERRVVELEEKAKLPLYMLKDKYDPAEFTLEERKALQAMREKKYVVESIGKIKFGEKSIVLDGQCDHILVDTNVKQCKLCNMIIHTGDDHKLDAMSDKRDKKYAPAVDLTPNTTSILEGLKEPLWKQQIPEQKAVEPENTITISRNVAEIFVRRNAGNPFHGDMVQEIRKAREEKGLDSHE